VRTYITGRNAERLEESAKALSGAAPCIPIVANLSSKDGTDALATKIAARESRLDILVNNAGASWVQPIEEYSEAGWDRVFDLNAKAPFFLTQKLLPLMTRGEGEQDWARVINIGSTAAEQVDPQGSGYGPSKAAMHQLTRVMARSLARHRITANCIAPGMFPSRLSDQLDPKIRESWVSRCPVGRQGTAEDAAGTAIYLCSRAGAFTNGRIIVLDGGHMA